MVASVPCESRHASFVLLSWGSVSTTSVCPSSGDLGRNGGPGRDAFRKTCAKGFRRQSLKASAWLKGSEREEKEYL